jgi:hypothetical protein
VSRVGRQEPVAASEGERVGGLEQRQSRRAVPARAPEPSSLDQGPILGSAERLRLRQEAIAVGESPAQPLDSRELGQDGRPLGRGRADREQRLELLFARVQVVEIPDVTPTVR